MEVAISGSQTTLSVVGQKAKREALKAGMTCKITHLGDKSTAKAVDCK